MLCTAFNTVYVKCRDSSIKYRFAINRSINNSLANVGHCKTLIGRLRKISETWGILLLFHVYFYCQKPNFIDVLFTHPMIFPVSYKKSQKCKTIGLELYIAKVLGRWQSCYRSYRIKKLRENIQFEEGQNKRKLEVVMNHRLKKRPVLASCT